MTCSVLRSPSRVATRVSRVRSEGVGAWVEGSGSVRSATFAVCSVACSAAWFPVQQKKRRLPGQQAKNLALAAFEAFARDQ